MLVASPMSDPLCFLPGTLLDGGTLSKALGQIKTFLENNPNEVITIFYENAANLAPSQFQVRDRKKKKPKRLHPVPFQVFLNCQ